MANLFKKYRFRIVRPGNPDKIVNPVIPDFVKVWTKEEDNQLIAENLEAAILFHEQDFEFFRQIEQTEECPDIELQIDMFCGGSWSATPFVTVRIDVRNGDWDYDTCTVQFNTLPVNGLECLQENWETEKNALQIVSKATVDSAVGTISVQQEVENFTDEPTILITAPRHANESVRLADGWRPVRTAILFTAYDEFNTSSGTITTDWIRETVTFPCAGGVGGTIDLPPGGGWTLVADNCATLGSADWYRTIETTLFQFDQGLGGNPNSWLWQYTSASQLELSIDNGLFLSDILDLLNDCGFSIKSDFFGKNAVGDAPANGAYIYDKTTCKTSFCGRKAISQTTMPARTPHRQV